MAFLIDTSVISELRKGQRADSSLLAWFRDVPAPDIYLSVLTLGEIRHGIENIRRRDMAAAGALESWLGRVSDTHRDRVLGIDRAIAEEWGRLGVPDPLLAIDGLLAATAKVTGLTLATRNTADFLNSGIALLNPFDAG